MDKRKCVELIKGVHEIQGLDGNWNHDSYMQGMYNGLELALSILENREVVYKDAPKEGFIDKDDKHKLEIVKKERGIK